jgi:glycerol-3-phosphate dehydrogenase subunit B
VKDSPAGSISHVVVIGSGVAGAAAAVMAASVARSVVVLDGGSGASTLTTGAIDLAFWQESPREGPARSLPEGATKVLAALAGYRVPEVGCTLITTAGLVRRADGCDAALLDIGSVGLGAIAVADCRRPGWNARELARSWGEKYAPLEASLFRYTDEAHLPDPDLAARHDDEARLAWLADRLKEALARAPGRWAAIVLPPVLGIDGARAQALSSAVGLPCGEAVGAPGGPVGLRFERSRDRALASAGATTLVGRASEVEPRDGIWRTTTEDGRVLDSYSVVIATGALIGGGLAYAPSEAALATALPSLVVPPMRLTLRAPLTVGARGRALDHPTSLFGFAPESIAQPFARSAVIETAGVIVQGAEGAGAPGLFAAGDIVADSQRTWLGALSAGAQAGLVAARSALSRAPPSGEAKPPEGPATPL